MKRLIVLIALSFALGVPAAETNTPPAKRTRGAVAALKADLAEAEAAQARLKGEFLKLYDNHALTIATQIVSNELAIAELNDAIEYGQEKAALEAMSPNNLVARLDAIRRGTSKGKYSEAAIVAALRVKGFEVLPTAPGLPLQIRRLPEAPAK
jgi:hypothetical protein